MLTEEQIEQYHRDGYLAPVPLLSADEAAALLAELEAAETTHPTDLHANNRNNVHLVLAGFGALACDDRILAVVEQLVGPVQGLWSSVLFAKDPATDAFVSWHQDSTYMGLRGENLVTPWVALTDSTIETGCVSVVPGSHRRGLQPHRDAYGEDNILTRGQHVEVTEDDTIAHMELRAGEMSLHHPWLIHGSQPNRSDRRRVGVALQSYLGTEVTTSDHRHVLTRVGGGAQPGAQFDVVDVPTTSFSESAQSTRAMANQALADVLYDGAEIRRTL